MSVTAVTTDTFKSEVLESDKPVLVDFWASWCGPCTMLSPIVDAVAESRNDIKFCKINVDEQPSLAIEYKVMSIPMLILFKNGQVAKKSIGLLDKDELLEFIDGDTNN